MRAGIAVSILGHLGLLMWVFLLFATPRPFASLPAEAITVDGLDAAVTVLNSAVVVRDRFVSQADPADSLGELLDFDRRLKASCLNPGTSADLTVATLFANRLNAS